MSEFLSMGGYATFVWPAYGITVAALALAIGATLSAYARAQRALRAAERTGGNA